MPPLTKHRATLHTAAVDVKILRLGGKQMTLSVFRQVPEESIFCFGRAGCSLGGLPWGRVVYTFDKAKLWTDYYLVWQCRDELKRTPLPRAINLEHWVDQSSCLREHWESDQRVLRYPKSLSLFSAFLCAEMVKARKEDGWEVFLSDDGAAVLEFLKQFEKLDQFFIAV